MDTIFRVLFLHMRFFWRRARGLFVSICSQRLHPCTSTPADTHVKRPPTPIPPSSASRIPPTISMARTKVWACRRARKLRAQMKERRKAKKQAMYARIAVAVAAVVGKGCVIEGEDEEEEDEEEAHEAPISSPPEPRRRRSLSPLQLPHWDISTPALGLELQLELGFDFPSPTESYTSTIAPRTPVTPITPTTPLIPPDSFYFPSSAKSDVATTAESEYPAPPPPPPYLPPLRANHLRRDPRIARGRFRTLSASITARSPLSLSFPLSFSLPLTVRRASSPCVVVVARGEEMEREDPFGRHGSGYYAASLGLGDAYDLSAWAWARDFSPRQRRGNKKRVRAATTGSGPASASSSSSVYRAPVHAASAPQLMTYAAQQRADGALEYSNVVANAGDGVDVDGERTPRAVRTPVPARECEVAAGPRRGMRPLLLPQKLGLLTIGATSDRDRKTENEVERADSWSSARYESGWDIDLERGV